MRTVSKKVKLHAVCQSDGLAELRKNPTYHRHHHHHHTTWLAWCKRAALQEHVIKFVWRVLYLSEKPWKQVRLQRATERCDGRRCRDEVRYIRRSMFGWPRLEMNGRPVWHDVPPGRPALTTKTTAGVDVTGRPSLAIDCQQGRPAYCRSDTCTRVHRAWIMIAIEESGV